MSTPYNFAAERASDLFVKPTPDAPDKSWQTVAERQVLVPQRALREIDDAVTANPPRVVRLYLESEQATSRDNYSMTWSLNFAGVPAFRPGSVLIWRDLAMNLVTNVPSLVLGLRGVRTLSYSTNTTTGFAFKTCAQIATGGVNGIYSTCNLNGDGGAPLAATLVDSDFMRTGSITLSLLETSNVQWDQFTVIRVGLMVVEPGATL